MFGYSWNGPRAKPNCATAAPAARSTPASVAAITRVRRVAAMPRVWHGGAALLFPNGDAAVGRHRAQLRAARAERRREAARDAALHRDGKVDVDAAVGRRRFERCRILLGQRHANAAVARLDVEA